VGKEHYRGYEPNNGSSCQDCDKVKPYDMHDPYDYDSDETGLEVFENELMLSLKILGVFVVFFVFFALAFLFSE